MPLALVELLYILDMSDSEGDNDDKQEVEEKETKGGKSGKKLEVKKWNAVALWAWGMYFAHSDSCTVEILGRMRI